MKKIFLLILASFLLTSVLAITDIAYIVNSPSQAQTNVLSEIEFLGLSYQIISGSEIPQTDFSNFKIILLGEGNIQNAPVNDLPSLIMNTRKSYTDDWASSTGFSTLSSAYNLKNHKITESLNSDFNSYIYVPSQPPQLYYLTNQKNPEVVPVTVKHNSATGRTQYVVALKEEPRRIFFGITESQYWTLDSRRLFRNSLSWVLEGAQNIPPELINQIQDISWFKDKTLTNHINLYDFFFDPDDEYLNFDVTGNNNIDIIINKGLVSFLPHEGWYGQEEVYFIASDSEFNIYSNKVILTVSHPNRPPEFTSHSPKEKSLKILEGQTKTFQVDYFDPDNKTQDLDFAWILDSQRISEKKIFVFNKPLGTYTLEAFVSDHEFNTSLLWNINVAKISDFNCNEISGDTCTQNQYCPEDYLNVNDTNYCCPVKCLEKPPEFRNIQNCSSRGIEINDDIEIEFAYSKLIGEFLPGELINADLSIFNRQNNDYRFELELYLYDLNRQEILESKTKRIRVQARTSEYIDFDFLIPERITNGEHAIFAIIKNNDINTCNQQYILFELKRKQDDLRFEKPVQKQKEIFCQDYIDVEFALKNWGIHDYKDVYVQIKNTELGISLESEKFDIREHTSSRNEYKGSFNIKLPENLEKESYRLTIEAIYNGLKTTDYIDLLIKDCESKNRIMISNDIMLASNPNDSYFENDILETKETKKDTSSSSLLQRIKKFIFWALNFN